MILPTISQYTDTVQDPHGLFRTLAQPAFESNAYGKPVVYAGGNAVVFRIKVGGKDFALKCFIKPVCRRAEVCDFVSGSRSSLLVPSIYLPEEIYVYGSGGKGHWYDVVLTEWVDGRSLDFRICKALHDGEPAELEFLARQFDEAARELLRCDWAHGDIKPENIILTTDGKLKFIDYDSIFFPLSADWANNQIGTPAWQHPRRNRHYFNRNIDDYPVAMLSATLHSLAQDISLHSRFGNDDILLFDPFEIAEGVSAGYQAAVEQAAESGNAPLYRLLRMLSSPVPELNGLEDVISSFSRIGRATHKEPLHAFNHGPCWGYKDSGGSIVIPPLFDSVLEFSEGLAAITLGKYKHFIDTSGKCVINCSGYDAVKSFRNGIASARSNRQWKYINSSGQETANNPIIP